VVRLMNQLKLEALAEAITHYSGYQEPGSALWQARNPLGLKAYSPLHKHDNSGNRIFASLLDGLQAGIYDLSLKLSGKSKAHLLPLSTLMDLETDQRCRPV